MKYTSILAKVKVLACEVLIFRKARRSDRCTAVRISSLRKVGAEWFDQRHFAETAFEGDSLLVHNGNSRARNIAVGMYDRTPANEGRLEGHVKDILEVLVFGHAVCMS